MSLDIFDQWREDLEKKEGADVADSTVAALYFKFGREALATISNQCLTDGIIDFQPLNLLRLQLIPTFPIDPSVSECLSESTGKPSVPECGDTRLVDSQLQAFPGDYAPWATPGSEHYN